jgi:hypothetical protein
MNLTALTDIQLDRGTATNQIAVWNDTSKRYVPTLNPSGPADGIFGHWTRDSGTTTITSAVSGDDLTLTGNLTLPDLGTISAVGGLGSGLITLSGTLGEVTVDGDLTVNDDINANEDINLIDTTSDSPFGIITKGNVRFIHNFKHSTGSTAIPFGGNVFVGDSAGNLSMGSTATSTSQASLNTGVGSEACSSITLGQKNNGIGTRALRDVEDGDENNAMGYSALRQLIGANGNCAMGSLALLQNRNGNQNTAVGTNAGQGVGADSPFGNTLIGFRAGYRIEDAQRNICIGHHAGSRISDEDNVLLISNQTEASFADEQLNAILYGVMNADPANQTFRINGQVEIGNTTTAQPLVVRGTSDLIGVVKSESGRITKDHLLIANTTIDETYDEVFCDTDSAGFTVTLPATPVGQRYRIINCGSNTLTIDPNGNNIVGSAINVTLNAGDVLIIKWNSTKGWY